MQQNKLISVNEAIKKIVKQFKKLSDEDIELTNALGRISAENVYAQTYNPNANVSSMDGYAINSKNKGNTFKTEFGTNPIGFLYCREDSISLRVVEELNLIDITNEYNEPIKLPLMFLLRDIIIKTELPDSQNRYDF